MSGRTRFSAEVEGGALRDLVTGERVALAPGQEGAEGAIVLAREGAVLATLAAPGTALGDLYRLAGGAGLDVAFGDEVMDEVQAIERARPVEDPALVDRTAIPFVTVDGPGARDLDQALHVEARPGGWTVRYALADAAHYVPRDGALFAEALGRGASYYLPGLSVPMLPRALSEGLVSLGPRVDRRALLFVMELDGAGHCTATRIERARIRSRAQLTFDEVQGLLDAPGSSALQGADFEPSLRAFREVGRARLREAAERDVVRYRRREVGVALDGATGFVVLEGLRREVELWNEQISLLVNGEGARILRECSSPSIQPIYRVHPPPEPERIESLRATVAAIAAAHRLDPARWVWDEHTSLALYLACLPVEGEHARVARAIQRQAILVNVRSTYATEPAPHHGVGLEPYGRFSAPMREIVGVYLHGEAIELLEGREATGEEELRARVVAAANASKDTQRRLGDLVNRRVLDRIFGPDLDRPREARRRYAGTVMGIGQGKLHVQLDEPGIDVKVYLRDAGRVWRAFLVPDELGVTLRERGGRVRATVGDAITVRVLERDRERDRYVLEPVER